MIYTSSSLALGLLEILVHIEANQIPDYFWVSTEIRTDKIRVVQNMPTDPADYGTGWLEEAGAPVGLMVPSVILPEVNVLLNPIHTDFADLQWADPLPLEIDRRLLRA